MGDVIAREVGVPIVARRAGVAPATAYTYFASKEHLVAEVVGHAHPIVLVLEVVQPVVPAVVPLLLLILPAMLTALAVVREKESGSITNLYVTPA